MTSKKSLWEYAAVAVLLVGLAFVVSRLMLPEPAADDATPEWLGVPVKKTPIDLWVLQEVIYTVKPDLIVEAGTYKGGGALFFASLQDMVGRGQVISIDIEDWGHKPAHDRITYLIGSSTSPPIIERVKQSIKPHDVVLVDLDSDHSKNHVLEELRAYAPLVSVGSYVIVEDTKINDYLLLRELWPGPLEAINKFLTENHDFVPDRNREKFSYISNPSGYLRRVR